MEALAGDNIGMNAQLFTVDIANRLRYPSTFNVLQGSAWMDMDDKKKKKHIHELTFVNHDRNKKEVIVRFNKFAWALHNVDGVYVSGQDNEPLYILE